MIVRGQNGGEERLEVYDCTKEEAFGVDLGRSVSKVGTGAKVSVRAVGVDGDPSEESEPLVL